MNARAVIICASAFLSSAMVSAQSPSEVALRQAEGGTYLTDTRGMTLYIYDGDKEPNRSSCAADCAQAWPPLEASGPAPSPEWAVVVRADGRKQWAWRGKPLYTLKRDTHPGAMLGDEAAGAWHVAFDPIVTPGGMTLNRTLAGRVIADSQGHTLYWREGVASASQPEPRVWSPFFASALAKPFGPWSVVIRRDGTRQWAYKDRALFTFGEDHKRGDINGHQSNGPWRAAALEPPPATPSWLTVQVIDTGKALADAAGMTLYAARSMDQIKNEKTCLEDCMRTYMRPVLAAADEKPVGNWSIITSEGEERQWAFNGVPVFTHTRDKKPGDSTGAGFAVGQGIGGGWRPIMQSALLPTL